MVTKINSQERKVIGRKFNKRTNFKNTNETCGADHGIVIFRNIIQYYRHGMDWTSWIKSSCRSWCRRHVYVVFTRISFDVENGRTGTGSTMHWTWRQRRSHKYAQTAVQLATLMGLLFAAVMLLFLHPLVGFFQLQDPEALQAALSYTKIACGLIVFSFLTLTLTGIYTAQGDSKTPFIANFIGLVTNMILDPLLILGLGPVNKFGGKWSCDRNGKCTGNRYDYFDHRNYPTEKRKCTKRNQIIYKNSIQISKWNLQDWYSNSDSGNGLLWNFHGINSYGFRVWSRSSCSPESRRAD